MLKREHLETLKLWDKQYSKKCTLCFEFLLYKQEYFQIVILENTQKMSTIFEAASMEELT